MILAQMYTGFLQQKNTNFAPYYNPKKKNE